MLNKSILKTAALLLLPALLVLPSCDPALRGDGDIVQETRNEKDFTGLNVSVEGKVNVKLGTDFKVEVQAEENLLPYLKTEVEAGELHVYFSRNVRDVDGLEVSVTMPALESMQLAGSAELVTDGVFEGAKLDLSVSGSGETRLNFIDYDALKVHLSGSGYIELKGTAGEMEAHLSGSGGIMALQCPVREADIHVSGSGSAKVDVAEKLTAHISGSGEVLYEGDPEVESEISGSGKVKKL